MKKTTILIILAVIAAGAAEVTLNPNADTGVWAAAPDQNFGSHYLL